MKPDVFVAIVAITQGVEVEITEREIIVTGDQSALDLLTGHAAPSERSPGRDVYRVRGV